MGIEHLGDLASHAMLAQSIQKQAEAAVADAVARAQAEADEARAVEASAAAAQRWIEALVEAVYLVAVADGSLTEAEHGALVSGLVALSAQDASAIESALATAMGHGSDGRDARLRAIAEVVVGTEAREAVFLVAGSVAWKSGGIGERQGLAVRGLGTAFGFADSRYFELLAQSRR